MASMFTRARNNRFKNTSFTIKTTNINQVPGQALNRLYDSVAPNAILNAGGRADEVRCHPGTREEVIRLIDKWRLDIQNNIIPNQMFWLSGPAGAGKTAIVQTVAEKWKLEGIHTANFFFFRTDTSRSHAESFVSTLLYQIFDFFPAMRGAVEQVLNMKPRILEAGLDEQVYELICNTFRSIQPPFPHQILLLIDGLDECDSETKSSQNQILKALDRLVHQEDLPFVILVASRAEAHISAAFRQLTSEMSSIFLDDQYSPETDIRLFVTAEFEKIRTWHPLAGLLPSHWPAHADVEAIVQKSSGQFIYAATIMRFLAQSSGVPSLSLEKVRGIVPCAKNSPFVHLDAFYTYILRQGDDEEAIRDILSSTLLDEEIIRQQRRRTRELDAPPPPSWTDGAEYLPQISLFLRLYDARYTDSLFMSCISDISSIVQLQAGRLVFYHASLSDHLLDQSRSGFFHVDPENFAAKVMPRVWHYNGDLFDGPETYILNLAILLLDFVNRPTSEITDILLTPHRFKLDMADFNLYVEFAFIDSHFLRTVQRLYYFSDLKTYKKILKCWINWAFLTCDSYNDFRRLSYYHNTMLKDISCWFRRRESDTFYGIPFLRTYLIVARMKKRISSTFNS